MLTKIKEFVKANKEDIILLIGVVLISLLSFAIGYIIAKQESKQPIQYESSYYRSWHHWPIFSLEALPERRESNRI